MLFISKEDCIPFVGETSRMNDPIVHIRLFHPLSNWIWYVLEYDPVEKIAYGLVVGFEKEFGYFSIAELEEIGRDREKTTLPIERDNFFTPTLLSKIKLSLGMK